MYFEVAWVSSGTQVQPQIILDPDYLKGRKKGDNKSAELIIANHTSKKVTFVQN